MWMKVAIFYTQVFHKTVMFYLSGDAKRFYYLTLSHSWLHCFCENRIIPAPRRLQDAHREGGGPQPEVLASQGAGRQLLTEQKSELNRNKVTDDFHARSGPRANKWLRNNRYHAQRTQLEK